MPRTLPWLTELTTPKAKQSKQASTPATANPATHDGDNDDLVDSDLNPLHPSLPPKKKRRLDRTPSTSPPAAPPPPPEVEYMREGYHVDDMWRMVEDEFYSTAQSFTQHIHRAEYVRLKKLAKSRGAGTLRSIARATDGKTKQSEELRVKLEGEQLARKRRAARRDEESSSGEEDDYMRDPQLAGLIMGETRSGKDLLTATNALPKTRAAAGFLQSPRSSEKTRDVFDARDAAEVSMRSSKTGRFDNVPNGEYETVEKPRIRIDGYDRSESGNIFKQFARKPSDADRDAPTVRSAQQRKASIDQSLSISPSRTKDHTLTTSNDNITTKESAREYLAKKRADKERKEREEKRKGKMADSIPTFLF